MRVLNVDVPTSILRCTGDVERYIPVGRISLDWGDSADWEYPTALSFRENTMEARRMRGVILLPAGEPIPPGMLVDAVHGVVRQIVDQLEDTGRVMDQRDYCGIEIEKDLQHWRFVLATVVKTWPAVEGVTVRVKDSTL